MRAQANSQDAKGVGCEEAAETLAGGGRRHHIIIRRILDDKAFQEAEPANAFVCSVTNDTYTLLMGTFRVLGEGIAAAMELKTAAEKLPGAPLHERFNNVLEAFRAFLNHTEYALKERYGSKSPIAATFKEACAAEYDQHFEYRLSYNLQNESRHKRNVIDVSYTSRLASPKGVERIVNMTVASAVFEDPKLSGWQPRVRDEVRAHARPIRADSLMVALRASTERIFAKTLIAQRSDIETAIARLRALATEAGCENGRSALIEQRHPDPHIARASMTLRITPLVVDAADTAEQALIDSENLLQ